MFLGLREFKGSKLRYSLMLAVVTLIAWLVFFLVGMADGLADETASVFENTPADYYVFNTESENTFSKSLLEKNIIQDLKQIKGVEDASYLCYTPAALLNNEQEKLETALFAIDEKGFIVPPIIEGKTLADVSINGVVVDSRLKADGYKLGDSFIVDGYDQPLTIEGITEGYAYLYLPVVFVHNQTWQEIRFADDNGKGGFIDPISVAVIKGGEEIEPTITNAIGGVNVLSKKAVVYDIPGYTQMDLSIKGMAWFVMVIAGLVLAVFFYVLTLQKTNQFGMLKAMGASNQYLMKSVLTQVMVITLSGLVLAIGLSYAMAAMIPPGTMPFKLNTSLVIGYSVAMIVIAFLSSLLSLLHITKIDPLQAMGRIA
ncbi:MAG TPA: ABC transporter permease [Desulfosporosinus sp.]|nr:ABC transporter permease [Desulfosporosinus sp.]